MPTFSCLEEIDVWQEARSFANRIYGCTSYSPFKEDFSLKDQIQRASNSISLNIAEGYGLRTKKEFIRHLTVARGSTKEVKAALYLALDQEYLDEPIFKELKEETEQLSRQITALMKYLENS